MKPLCLNLMASSICQKSRTRKTTLFSRLIYGIKQTTLKSDIGADNLGIIFNQGNLNQKCPRGQLFTNVLTINQIFKAGSWNSFGHIFKVKLQSFNRIFNNVFFFIGSRKNGWQIRKLHTKGRTFILMNKGEITAHNNSPFLRRLAVYNQPACFAIDLAVPKGKSFFGWGTITTRPSFLNLWWLPLTLISSKPSSLSRLIIFELLRSMFSPPLCVYKYTLLKINSIENAQINTHLLKMTRLLGVLS